MAVPYAFVTLLTSDFYLNGALTLAAALRDVHPSPAVSPEVDFQTVCLVTPESVDVSTTKLLRRAFDVVIGVEIITQRDDKNLKLLGRLDLNTVLTKLHVFRLTQYSKVIFLDADVLPIRPLSHLFTLPHEFSAVPDVGWPDIFNSGVLVLSPGNDNFDQLSALLDSKGTWDGGDQGILNEWRGDNWNRLSFTYNTTPTAAYTYAPAYERYGSQISAIHFIGPNKPWHSASYRPPFQQESSQDTSNQQAYNYASLVDRWFAVYDSHYRAQELLPSADFEVKRYQSAWDSQTQQASTSPDNVIGTGGGRSLGLDELKKMAIQGISSSGFTSQGSSGEGEYKSLPLEGRFDLIHRAPAEREGSVTPQAVHILPAQDVTFVTTMPPTPGPNEVPPSPILQSVPLPPLTPTASVPSPLQHHEQRPHEYNRNHQRQYLQPEHQIHHEPPRPASPPKLIWNPSVEPPPNVAPAPSTFPSATYFTNIWDQHPSQHPRQRYDQPHQQKHNDTSPPLPESGSFFRPPPTPEIPASLITQGHYRRVTGEGPATGITPSPDPGKVKTVFPWEEKPRHMPERKFPDSDGPLPSLFTGPETPPINQSTVTSPSSQSQRVYSPGHGLPNSLSYANAWDTVPSIQKYAERLIRPPQPPPLAPAFEDKEWRKSWDDKSEGDGDDEDDGDEEDSETHQKEKQDDSDREGTTYSASSVKARSRRDSESVSASYIIKGKKKEYRVRGVQTVAREVRSMGVQVNTNAPVVYQSPTSPTRPEDQDQGQGMGHHRPRTSSSSSFSRGNGRKHWVPSGATLAPITVSGGATELPMTTAIPSPMGARESGMAPSTPPGMKSPREYAFPEAPGTARQTKAPATIATTPPPRPKVRSNTSEDSSPGVLRQLSNDGSSLASPQSSVGPVSPTEGQPIMSSGTRKAGRVWDPARGVELFKRGSEEVLARFLRMSSWEEENGGQHP